MELMGEGHQESVDVFQNAAANMQDPEVKSFSSGAVTALQQHLDRPK